MTTERTFMAVVCAGHKERAVEVPFDPGTEWGLESSSFAFGRTGFSVRAIIAGVPFTGHVVRRSGKFWLLLPSGVESCVLLGVGDRIEVSLARRAV